VQGVDIGVRAPLKKEALVSNWFNMYKYVVVSDVKRIERSEGFSGVREYLKKIAIDVFKKVISGSFGKSRKFTWIKAVAVSLGN